MEKDLVYIPTLDELICERRDRELPEDVMVHKYYANMKDREIGKTSNIHISELDRLVVLHSVYGSMAHTSKVSLRAKK